ncbi:MAG: Gfo/Idh/MocA family oxidoreductase [Oscillospiraceae bacterium]|jgi:predicted dehydrogenase|nr:Gfo/Idh/MocA family oxidoreductase [Oscillospiraceae bacterium]
MAKLKVGIVGCGGIANQKHLPSVRKTGLADAVAFCDLLPGRAEEAAKEFGTPDAKVYKDYRDLLKLDLDAVYVCTPNRSHSEITVAALEAKKHVMCEKPMAINYTEALKMTDAAKRNGKLLTIGYQNRYRADSLFLKRECEAGVLGEIYYAKAKAIRRRAVPTWGVFLNEYEQGGGPLIDIGTHALDLTLWMMDNYTPKTVTGASFHKLNGEKEPANAFGAWDPKAFTVEDSAFGFIAMENGAVIQLETSWALNSLEVGEARTLLCGTKAGADMNDGLTVNGVRHNCQYEFKPSFGRGGVDFYAGDNDEPPVREQKIFLGAVKGENELTVLPEQAMAVTRILDAVYESAKTGRQVVF